VLTWPAGDVIDSAGDRYYLGGIAGKARPWRSAFGRASPTVPRLRRQWVERLYRRAALERVGLFPESFGQLFRGRGPRVSSASGRLPGVYERRRACCTTSPHRTAAAAGGLFERQSCNEERVFWRNMPASALARAAPRHLACSRASVAALSGWDADALAAGRLRVLAKSAS